MNSIRNTIWQWLEAYTDIPRRDKLPDGDYEMFPNLEDLANLLEQAQPAQPTPDDESVAQMDAYYAVRSHEFDDTDKATLHARFMEWVDAQVKAECFDDSEFATYWRILRKNLHQAEEQAAARALEGAAKIFDGFAARMKQIKNYDEFHQAEQDAKCIRALLPSSFTSKGGA